VTWEREEGRERGRESMGNEGRKGEERRREREGEVSRPHGHFSKVGECQFESL